MIRFFTLTLLLLAAFAANTNPSIGQTNDGETTEPSPRRITLEARLIADGPVITSGVEWRIFGIDLDAEGKLPLLASAFGGAKTFDMVMGEYLVHAAYGHAGAVRRIKVDANTTAEVFDLNAGALKLDAIAAIDTPIPSNYLKFDVYSSKEDEFGQRKLIARALNANEVVPFPIGTYHVVSSFGDLNAEIRADLRVQPGKMTEANLEHRAALLTFRLVKSEGGDAIADTAWSILTESGDVIKESRSAVPVMVLAEGNYTAIARNNETIFSTNFEVKSGLFRDIEVLAEQ